MTQVIIKGVGTSVLEFCLKSQLPKLCVGQRIFVPHIPANNSYLPQPGDLSCTKEKMIKRKQTKRIAIGLLVMHKSITTMFTDIDDEVDLQHIF